MTARPMATPPASAAPLPSPSQEYALYDYAVRLARHREGRIAVHIHLSRLQSYNRRDHHIRVAINTFETLVKQFEGQLFVLQNNDLVFVCRGAAVEDVDEAVLRLRYLFSEDPLTRFTEDQGDPTFCTWYIMEHDHARFLAMARRFHEMSEAQRLERHRVRQQASRNRSPLTPELLAKLEGALASADLTSLVRNQSVCAVTTADIPRPIFEEIYVSIEDLEKALIPNVSASADPWLFQRLTTVLDRRMLSQILRDDNRTSRAFSLNLNVATILSNDFQKFDQGVGFGVRGRLVIEVQKVDIFHDMGAYFFARDYAQERGYKICLDGITHLTLPFIDRERLGIDLIKMYWGPELTGAARPELLDDLAARIQDIGQSRMILCRCDGEEAISIGQRLGIALFQGRFVDHLVSRQQSITEYRTNGARFLR